MKKVAKIHKAPPKHWVGDGFHVHNIFHYRQNHINLDPFLMLDYAAPKYFSSNPLQPRGIEEHPHRGFETITIVYQGEVTHQDSTGGGGVIGAGDVQWMTAGSGLMHKELHSKNFSASGGMFEIAQLWINLPSKNKMTTPRYQAILSQEIPTVALQNDGQVRVIAGEFDGVRGVADTFTPINLWDIQLKQQSKQNFKLPESHNLLVFVQTGDIQINQKYKAVATDLISFDDTGQSISIYADSDARILLLSGEPLNEPVFGHGPFVMNSKEEIQQAILDVQEGNFGKIAE